jgi:hypothetical protein
MGGGKYSIAHFFVSYCKTKPQSTEEYQVCPLARDVFNLGI